MEQSFKRGYSQIPDFRKEEVKAEIMTALDLENDPQWWRRIRGECNLNPAEREAIEKIYLKFNIVEVWGSENFQIPS